MSDPTHTAQPRSGRLARMVVVFVVLIAAAAAVYFSMIRQKGPRRLKLAIVTWTEDPFWQPLLKGAQDCASSADVELTTIRSKPTVEAQTQHLKDLIAAGVDGIAVSPNDAVAEKAILDELASKMPLVTFDTDAPATQRKRFVGIDNYAAGRMCADEMREALPDGGPVMITVGSVTQLHGRDRRQGAVDGLLDRGFDRNRAESSADPIDTPLKGAKYTIVSTVTDGGDPSKAVATIAAALKAHPEVKGVIGLYSYSAPAVLDAAKQIGKTDKLQIIGFDESDETQAAILAGAIHSSILQDSYRAGFESIEVLANECRGTQRGPAEASPVLNVGINVLTDKNLNDLRATGSIRQPAATTGPTGS